jgi:hypothetical protein
MKRSLQWAATALLCGPVLGPCFVNAQTPTAIASPSGGAQQSVAQAAAQGRYSFIVFYRDDNDLTRAMMQAVTAKATARPDFGVPTFVQITNPAEAAIVRQYDVSRAPMPLTLVTAPNGAITGAFPQRVTEQQLDETFVTPAMSHCMKAMQEGKIVFLCLQTTPQFLVSPGVAEFLADPQFKDRAQAVPVQAADPVEAELLKELELGTQPGQASTACFAPPGVLVGKFNPASSKIEIAAALHKAGKCCDDPNCKHNHAAKPGGSIR